MFSIEIPHRFFQIHLLIAEIKPRVSVNLSWNRCGIHIDHRQFSCATSVKFSLLLKFYGYACHIESTCYPEKFHTDFGLNSYRFFVLFTSLYSTVETTPIIRANSTCNLYGTFLITCRFNVSFPINFHCCEKK